MEFERKRGDEAKVSRIYQRALRALTPDLREELMINEIKFKYGNIS